jgi:hypothetical protein
MMIYDEPTIVIYLTVNFWPWAAGFSDPNPEESDDSQPPEQKAKALKAEMRAVHHWKQILLATFGHTSSIICTSFWHMFDYFC